MSVADQLRCLDDALARAEAVKARLTVFLDGPLADALGRSDRGRRLRRRVRAGLEVGLRPAPVRSVAPGRWIADPNGQGSVGGITEQAAAVGRLVGPEKVRAFERPGGAGAGVKTPAGGSWRVVVDALDPTHDRSSGPWAGPWRDRPAPAPLRLDRYGQVGDPLDARCDSAVLRIEERLGAEAAADDRSMRAVAFVTRACPCVSRWDAEVARLLRWIAARTGAGRRLRWSTLSGLATATEAWQATHPGAPLSPPPSGDPTATAMADRERHVATITAARRAHDQPVGEAEGAQETRWYGLLVWREALQRQFPEALEATFPDALRLELGRRLGGTADEALSDRLAALTRALEELARRPLPPKH